MFALFYIWCDCRYKILRDESFAFTDQIFRREGECKARNAEMLILIFTFTFTYSCIWTSVGMKRQSIEIWEFGSEKKGFFLLNFSHSGWNIASI